MKGFFDLAPGFLKMISSASSKTCFFHVLLIFLSAYFFFFFYYDFYFLVVFAILIPLFGLSRFLLATIYS